MLVSETKGLYKLNYQLRETKCNITTDKRSALEAAVSSINNHRVALEEYINKYPTFQSALEPIEIVGAPKVVRLMAKASKRASVGPMAAVAGVLADLAVKDMLDIGARVAMVENGGEACIFSDRPIVIALQAGDAPLSRRFGFRLENFPIGVATSSGLFSHALSFGDAEAVTIFAVNAGVADAAATAVANAVKGEEKEKVIDKAITLGLSIEDVQGILVLYREYVGLGGEIPNIIGLDPYECAPGTNRAS
jgi:ApbE superfamily uncharacterized protein (UPF0280 family)